MSGNESALILSTKNLTSAPATNAFPAPSSTIVLTESSAFALSMAVPNCPTTVSFRAFIASGLLMVIVAIPLFTAKST